MGLDLMELTFRLEKSFKMKLPQMWPDEVADISRRDIQAGRIHDYVCELLTKDSQPIPPSAWHRVKLSIAQVVREPPSKVRRESWLVKELGFG